MMNPPPGQKGTLYLVATPIGNLNDITHRAIETLKCTDLILAEDTRHARILMKTYEIQRPTRSYHDHNKEKQTPYVLERLESGDKVALITDAGSPGIADPGFYLVRAAIERGIDIIPIPGPSALIAALSASGLPTDSFVFCGFLPRKKGKRTRLLTDLAEMNRTVILYESPYRVLATLEDIQSVFGEDRRVVVARELTKVFEEFLRGAVKEIVSRLSERREIKGEYVILIAGKGYEHKEEAKD